MPDNPSVTRAECEAIIKTPSWWICTKCGWNGIAHEEHEHKNCPYETFEAAHQEKRLARAYLALLEECESLRTDKKRLDKVLASHVYQRHMSRPLKDRDDIDALPDPPETK